MADFEQLGLRSDLLAGIRDIGFETPSPIQAEVIPCLLNETGDVVGLAQTGTGKTAAFGLPMLQLTQCSQAQTQGLVLAPTRELCVQIATELGRYAAKIPDIHIVAVYGGEDIRKQLKQLDKTPHIVVATPGRLLDLLKRKKIQLQHISVLVLDEADEMLNMGFLEDITAIIEQTPAERRTLLFSATMPREIADIAKNYMHDAKEIAVGKRGEAAKNVEHYYALTKPTYRYEVLKRLLDFHPDIYGIVFCRTRQETKDIADQLMTDGYDADALHGDLSQVQRDSVMARFRNRHLQILVATDVAARGLDVNDLTHVIHYNLPDDKETYTHRSGRTGRVNKSGISIALVTPREKGALRPIEKAIQREFQALSIPSGVEVCRRQALYLVESMKQVQVDETMQTFLPDVLEQVQAMSKEDIVSQFLALRFNRFLEYYRHATDLETLSPESHSETYKKSRREMRRADKGDSLRLKINKGSRDGFEPKRLLGLINDVTQNRSIVIGDIDISPKFSFFDVPKNQVSKLKLAFESNPRAKGIQLAEVKGEQGEGSRRQRKEERLKRSEGYTNADRKTPIRREERGNRRRDKHENNTPRRDSSRVSKRKHWD